MVKVFTPNKNGKIEFTKKELEELLNEVWRDGYNSNYNYYWRSPVTWRDWEITTTPYVTWNADSSSTFTVDNGENVVPTTTIKVGE